MAGLREPVAGRRSRWSGPAPVARGPNLLFKFLKKDGAGRVTWEGADNRVFTVPEAATTTVSGVWR